VHYVCFTVISSTCFCRDTETNFSSPSDQLLNFCLIFQMLPIEETDLWCNAHTLTTNNVTEVTLTVFPCLLYYELATIYCDIG
jgi:hypothetical protein